MNRCARATCPRAARPGRNRGLCEAHYHAAPHRGYTTTTAARERITLLRARGVTLRMLADRGLSRCAVRAIQTRPRMLRLTEMKVMDYPIPAPQSTGAPVEATATRRRLRALAALGWPQTRIGAELGISQNSVTGIHQRGTVTSATAVAVAQLYDRWSMLPGPSEIARRRAAAAGWAPPLAWDDDTIGDPTAIPEFGPPPSNEARVVDKVERRDTAAYLTRCGLSLGEISERLDVSTRTVIRYRRESEQVS